MRGYSYYLSIFLRCEVIHIIYTMQTIVLIFIAIITTFQSQYFPDFFKCLLSKNFKPFFQSMRVDCSHSAVHTLEYFKLLNQLS